MKRFKKIILYTILSLVLFIVGAYLYLVPFGGTESIINSRISSALEDNDQLDIHIGDIQGDVLSGIVLKDISVYYNDSTQRYQMASIPIVSAVYSWKNLINYNLVFESIYIDSADFTIKKDKDGNLIIPALFKGKNKTDTVKEASDISGGLSGFLVDDFFIKNSTVNYLAPEDSINVSKLTAKLAVTQENNTTSIDLKHLEFLSNFKNLKIDGSRGKITLANGQALFKEFTIIKDDSRIKLDGQMNLKAPYNGEVRIHANQIDLLTIHEFGGPKLKGVVDVNGDVSLNNNVIKGSIDIGGEFLFLPMKNLNLDFEIADNIIKLDTLYGLVFGDCYLDGKGEVSIKEQTYTLEAEVKQFDLYNLLNKGFHSNINGSVYLNGKSFSNAGLNLYLDVDLYESEFDEYPLQTASGDFVVYYDSLVFLDSFKVTYFENDFYTSGVVDYDENMHLDVLAELNNLDRYKGKLFLDQPGGRGRAEAVISGATNYPDLKATFESDSLWLYGLYSDSFKADVDIDRFLSGKQGKVDINFYNGDAWNIPYDTGLALLTIDSNYLFIDTFYMNNTYSKLTGKGLYDFGVYPSRMSIDSFHINLTGQSFYNREKMVIDIDSNGFILNSPSIGNNDQWVVANGEIGFDESMDVIVSLNNIPIKPWMSLYEDTLDISGNLSADAYLLGTFSKPKFTLKTEIDSLVYQDLLLGDVSASLKYDSLLLTIDSSFVITDSGHYSASGYMYTDLAFTTDSLERFPDKPMDISVKAYDRQFDLVIFALPSIEEINGLFQTEFKLFGTPHNPKLAGNAALYGYYVYNEDRSDSTFVSANLKYFDLEEYVYTDSAFIEMTDNIIQLDSIVAFVYENKRTPRDVAEGRKGRSSDALITGDIRVKSMNEFEYNVAVKVSNQKRPLPFTYELDNISGKATCDLTITRSTPPLISGTVNVVQLNYIVEFAEANAGTPTMMTFLGESGWDLDIDFDIPSNYFIKNEDIDAEFSGEINMERESGVYKFAGYMEILRGKGYLFDKTFELDPGGTITFEGDDEFNPTLDLTGYTRVRTAGGLAEEDNISTEVKKLGIQVSGTLEEPIITPTEDSDFGSNEDIMLAIFANVGSSESLGNMGRFDQRAYDMLSAQVEKIFSRQLNTVGVETFEINPSYGGNFDPLETQVTVGASVFSPNLYVYGSTSLSLQSRHEAGFEYRFNKSWMLQGLRDEDELYHLNLRFNLEF